MTVYDDLIKEKYPWFFERNQLLVMSNDLDSYLTCCLLAEHFQHKIGYFYDFTELYANSLGVQNNYKDAVYVDIALTKFDGKALDNHVTALGQGDQHNKNCINPNIFENITRANYAKKYAGSTFLLAWGLLNRPLPKTDDGKIILLALDGHKSYYHPNFKEVSHNYLKKLGMEELIYIINKYTSDDFYKLFGKFKLNSEFAMVDGKIKNPKAKEKIEEIASLLNIQSLKVKQDFKKIKSFDLIKGEVGPIKDKRCFSFALTYKDSFIASIERELLAA